MRVMLFRVVVVGFVVCLCGCVLPVAVGAFEVQPGSFGVVPSSVQAGAHADLTTSFVFTTDRAGSVGGLLRSAEVVLPVGFAGYPVNVKTCSPVELQLNTCPVDSQIGILEVVFRKGYEYYVTYYLPVFNMVPPPGYTAIFGFGALHVISGNIVATVGSDYRVRASAVNVVTGSELVRQSLTIWGVPADPGHNALRGFTYCAKIGESPSLICDGEGGVPVNENPVPYLVNPTQCGNVPLTAELVGVESWEGEAASGMEASVGPFTGCESLKFAPTISAAPEQTQATTPTGYEVDLHVPQTEGAEGLATADLKDAVVQDARGRRALPLGGDGPGIVQRSRRSGLDTEQPVECPNASKLGTVSVITPALTGELKGSLYLGGPPSGPITSPPFTVYLTFEGHGVHVKIRGTVTPDPATGQITTTFDENPELPVQRTETPSERRLARDAREPERPAAPTAPKRTSRRGARRSRRTRRRRARRSRSPAAARRASNPSFEAGTTSNQAGGYSPLSVTFAREDADEDLGGLSVTTPPGLSGNLTGIPLCGEPQAAEGTCPAASQIGELTAGAGPGPEPVFIKGGRVFLTGPYDGAPFGLSIDVSERAGPLDLGSGPCDCEVVRATVSVNPQTAQLTVTNGALPTGKYGIPFQVKKVNVLINRPNFVFNPTNCNPLSVNGTLASTQGMLAQIVCTTSRSPTAPRWPSTPSFKVSTSGRTTREEGASLDAKLSYPSAPFGTQTNIALAKLQLPRQLPSRLTTLQKACPAAHLRSQPSSLPRGLPGRRRPGDHPDHPRAPHRPGVLRLPRRRSVPRPDRRPPGLRRDR